MKKKFLCIIILILLTLTSCHSGKSIDESGKTVNVNSKEYELKKDPIASDFSWIINNGTLTVKGHGSMPDFAISETPWITEKDDISKVVISNGITHIGDYAFYNCDNLMRVYIPSSVKSIGDNTFRTCEKLTAVSFPQSVTHIGSYAFAECDSITSLAIYKNVNYIGRGAFSACDSLASINVESSNKNYSSQNGILFNKDKTSLINYPPAKTESSYKIPNSVTTLEISAFASCGNLELIIIPDGVKTIGWDAFNGCFNMPFINIPGSVTSIGQNAFMSCFDLVYINVDPSNPKYASENGVLFSKDKKNLICYPEGKTEKDYSVPSGTEVIEREAFQFNRKITSVSIPNGVTKIYAYAFWYCERLDTVSIPSSVTFIGSDAFEGCKSLKTIVFDGTKAQWEAIEKNEFADVSVTVICTDGEVEEQFFAQ